MSSIQNIVYTLKTIVLFLLVPFLFVSCQSPGEIEQKLAGDILKIDSGLLISGAPSGNLSNRMSHYGVPGLSIAVIENYQIKWVRSFGVMNKTDTEPVTENTLFQAGSVSKPVAALGALKLVETGKLNLDDNVNQYLTSWQVPENEFTKNDKVNLRLLLCHGAGITVHGFPGYNIYEEVPSLLNILDGQPPANSDPIRVDKIPGESFRYSGGGYCIIQQMMIDVTHQPFPKLMDSLVINPLKMTHSTYLQPLPPSELAFAATGYLPNGNMTKGKRHTYPEMAAAGLWTTANDLAKFVIEIQLSLQNKSNKILSQDMANQMMTPQVASYIGLGIFLSEKPDKLYFEHSGWDEGFSSLIHAHRDKGYGTVILINANKPEFIEELVKAISIAYEWE